MPLFRKGHRTVAESRADPRARAPRVLRIIGPVINGDPPRRRRPLILIKDIDHRRVTEFKISKDDNKENQVMYTVVNSTIEPSEKGVLQSLAHGDASPQRTYNYIFTVYIPLYSVATRRHSKRHYANNPAYPAPIDVSHQN
ncbi:hypothetical protein EVAR_41176_1 [Eumeta japonica]|uniref:Uncharacterized protein n=1 Tax=Eumeta variegata TaxID=151549 RepID=A0A4C2ACX6_EUMVA|nr:hypothetical protein EVAR_41176_1 [Eumeta japonica]